MSYAWFGVHDGGDIEPFPGACVHSAEMVYIADKSDSRHSPGRSARPARRHGNRKGEPDGAAGRVSSQSLGQAPASLMATGTRTCWTRRRRLPGPGSSADDLRWEVCTVNGRTAAPGVTPVPSAVVSGASQSASCSRAATAPTGPARCVDCAALRHQVAGLAGVAEEGHRGAARPPSGAGFPELGGVRPRRSRRYVPPGYRRAFRRVGKVSQNNRAPYRCANPANGGVGPWRRSRRRRCHRRRTFSDSSMSSGTGIVEPSCDAASPTGRAPSDRHVGRRD